MPRTLTWRLSCLRFRVAGFSLGFCFATATDMAIVLYFRASPCVCSSPATAALKMMSTLPHTTKTSVHISSICCAQDDEGSRDATAEHAHAKPEHPPCQGSRCTNARVHALVCTRMRRVGVGGCLRTLKVCTCQGAHQEGEQHHVGKKMTLVFHVHN